MNPGDAKPQLTEFICKPGELLLKSKPVRTAFSRQLIHNLRDASGAEAGSTPGATSIFREQGVYTVRTRDPGIAQSIRCVFGITSISSVHRFESGDLEDIVARSCLFFQPYVTGKRFAVRCHRSGNTGFRSIDVARALGAALLPHASGVDLSHPEAVCKLDIHDATIRLYRETVPAFGGLPVGTQGKAVALISGGIDSPVAAWYGLKRGLEVHYLFCCLGGPLQLWGPRSAARHLALNWSYGYRPQLYVADFNELLLELNKIDHRYRNILLKRYFFRAADRLADSIGADAIITGESLGQVSSQTLSNLGMISRVTQRLIFRPLIGLDKTEIIEMARKIGTLETSEKVPEFCNVSIRKPKTRSHPADVEMHENKIHPETVERSCTCWVKTDIKQMPAFLEEQSLLMDRKPPGAWLIWIARPDIKTEPPAGTDQVIDMLELSGILKRFSRPGIVLFACQHGTISRDAASYAREQGLDAYALDHRSFPSPFQYLQD